MNAGKFIAQRLRDKGNRIAWISVALSVAVMVVAVVVVAGFKSEIKSKVTGVMGSVTLVAPGQSPINENCPFSDSVSWLGAVDSLRSVSSISGVGYRSGLIKTDEDIHGLYFKGVDSLYDMSFFSAALVEGRLPDFSGGISNDAMISRPLASKLGLKAGDRMTVYFIGDDVKVRRFDICGLYEAQLEEIDQTFGLVDLRQVRRLNGWEKGQVSSIEIRTTPRADIDDVAGMIENIGFTSVQDDDPALFVMSVKRLYAHLFDWLALLDLNVLMILALMMAVAGFNMISAILIILFRRISMIGVLKSVGMTSRAVTGVFLRKAAVLVGKGMLLGNAFALGLCLIQKYTHVMKLNPENYFVGYVPVDFNWPGLVLMNVISFIVIMLILSLSSAFVSKVSPAVTMKVD